MGRAQCVASVDLDPDSYSIVRHHDVHRRAIHRLDPGSCCRAIFARVLRHRGNGARDPRRRETCALVLRHRENGVRHLSIDAHALRHLGIDARDPHRHESAGRAHHHPENARPDCGLETVHRESVPRTRSHRRPDHRQNGRVDENESAISEIASSAGNSCTSSKQEPRAGRLRSSRHRETRSRSAPSEGLLRRAKVHLGCGSIRTNGMAVRTAAASTALLSRRPDSWIWSRLSP